MVHGFSEAGKIPERSAEESTDQQEVTKTIQSVLTGNEQEKNEAWENLQQMIKPIVKQEARKRLVGFSEEDFDELVNKTLFFIYEKLGSYSAQKGNFGGWVRIVVQRRVIDFVRSRRGRHKESAKRKIKVVGLEDLGDEENGSFWEKVLPSSEENPEEALLAKDSQKKVRAILPLLNDNEKAIFIMRYIFDTKLKQIGKILGVSESRISQILKEASRKVRDKLDRGSRPESISEMDYAAILEQVNQLLEQADGAVKQSKKRAS